ncbi:hypothetical protein [Saccharothrix variisporea]|uniref:Small secreted protein n=1 Tax=Saccharothrix variisporea TaxID=543527 RepID=A0A495XEI6_9PSEU|nr:hypothetical protein [Saccharothrix variisporea]RKT71224.1 hypothetical protein DFJ66_4505 [Saccharothrix variisporea]
MKKTIAVAGALAAVLVTGACSGSGSSGSSSAPTTTTTTTAAATADPVKWSGTFCAGITPTAEAIVELLKTVLSGQSDPAAQKAALMAYAEKGGKALSDAAKELEELGAPTEKTKAAHDEVVKSFTEAGEKLQAAAGELAKLDPNDPEFATKLEQLGGDEADPSKLQAQVDKLRNDPELSQAFQKAPECVEMAEKLKGLGG